MKAAEAAVLASRWVREEAPSRLAGLCGEAPRGAYLSGSILTAGAWEEWPESSDVDVMLVFPAGACPRKLGKFRWNGLLLEVSCLEDRELSSLEQILSTHYLAYALEAGGILLDQDGFLTGLHRQVAARYGERRWVEARVRALLERVCQGTEGFDPAASLAAQTMNFVFAAGIACFPILAAALENCTVRKRYPAARRVLEQYGMGAFYPRLLHHLVPEPLGREGLLRHLMELERTFRLASKSRGPSASCAFREDISPEGEDVALAGSRELILSAFPEDAVFWMAVTFARCHTILDLDAPALSREREPAFRAFLLDLGIRGQEDFLPRLRSLADFLPELEAAAGKLADEREREEVKS